jgi:predicted NodU family carbamoyl transferase
VEQLKSSETSMKNLFYREQEARQVLELDYKELAFECKKLKEAPSRLAAYVKHMARSIPRQVLAFMKLYFPKAPVEVVAGGVAANCTDE